jgi:hypothetical protein
MHRRRTAGFEASAARDRRRPVQTVSSVKVSMASEVWTYLIKTSTTQNQNFFIMALDCFTPSIKSRYRKDVASGTTIPGP